MNRLFHIILPLLSVFNIEAVASDGSIVGKINDNYEVTPTGQFHYDIPISVVSGTGGMTPQLSIAYNSSNSSGLLGYGFDLTGLSQISRSPENLYRDGKADVIRFDASDRFALDGVRLSLVKRTATYREYKTEVNNFAKIIAEGDEVNPSKFTVYTKDGLVKEFLSAKTLLGGNGNDIYWLETKVLDTKGNYFTIKYGGSTTYNEYYPIKIDYTGNSDTALSPFASVRFSYVAGTTKCHSYISGEKLLKSHVIKEIVCCYGNELVRRYDIEYSRVRGNIFMTQISETAGDEKKNPTSFSWKNNNSISVHNTASSDKNFKDKNITIGDFNGDGMSDLLVRANNNSKDLNYKIYLSNGTTFDSPLSGQFILPSESSDKNRIDEIRSGDFNGDGYDDIIVERANSPFYAIDFYLSKVSTDGTFCLAYDKTVIKAINFEHTMTVMDSNCDGKADVFIRNKNYYSNTYYTLLSDTENEIDNPSEIANDYWDGEVLLVNLDGDGTKEVLNIHDDLSVLYMMQPSGILEKSVGFSIGKNDYFCVGDFNGDGKTDILTMGSVKQPNAQWEINLSTGLIGEGKTTFCATGVSTLFSPKDKSVFVADLNGDGYDDLYAINKNTSDNKKTAADIYINVGGGKTFEHYLGAAVYGTDKQSYNFGDFNGDGKADFICNAKPKDGTEGYDLYIVNNEDNNLLMAITDGFGNTTQIDFKRLTDKSVFTRGTETDYPLVSVCCPYPVVSRISTPDGIGGKHSIDYYYTNLLQHKRGRGILCFEKVTATDNATGFTSVSQYEVVNSENIPALKRVSTSINGTLVKEIDYTNSLSYQLNNGNQEVSFTCFPSKITERSFEYNSGVMTSEIVTDTEYDEYGNAVKTTVSNGTNIVTTVNTYTNDEEKWMLGRLTKAVVTKSDENESTELTSEFEYDSASGLLTTERFEPDESNGYVKTYSYDIYGNVVESEVAPNGSNNDGRKTYTEYSADGRFKVKTTNSLGFTCTSVVNNAFGVETNNTDANGVITTYQYNAFGDVTAETTPLSSTKITTAWSCGQEDEPENSVYYVKTETTGMPTQWNFFDGL